MAGDVKNYEYNILLPVKVFIKCTEIVETAPVQRTTNVRKSDFPRPPSRTGTTKCTEIDL